MDAVAGTGFPEHGASHGPPADTNRMRRGGYSNAGYRVAFHFDPIIAYTVPNVITSN